ncbi:hypothetical protein B0H34DRAFT_792449 [Crassisporium funariophilum]|nr:hypothetical protein B0H34DRAFT_792449 [Crassisporium funariophilum]
MATVASAPFNVSLALLSKGLSAVRPYAPRLIPLLVCSFFIPLIIILSLSAGWVVWSSLSVSWEVPLYLQYGDGVSPYAYAVIPKLTPQQRYDISVDLLVPFTESNLLVGNFMTTLALSTLSNKTLARVRRPAIALPKPSRFLFSSPSSARVKIPLLESFSASAPSLAASVEIGRRDGWTTLGTGQGRELSVASATLRGLVVPHGTRGLAIRFPILSAIASASIFLLILSLILGTCVLPLFLQNTATDDDDVAKDEAELHSPSLPSSSQVNDDDRPSRPRRRRSKPSKTSTERTDVKTEAPVQTIPSPDSEDPTRGLRRRSSKPIIGPSDTAK